jgi:hypothetical protein
MNSLKKLSQKLKSIDEWCHIIAWLFFDVFICAVDPEWYRLAYNLAKTKGEKRYIYKEDIRG